MSDRRQFIKQISVLPLLGLSQGFVFPAHNEFQSKDRHMLKNPVPMIPPVPAILTTVHGLEKDDPDEITVLWTFVVNSKPAQIGVTVADKHVAGPMIRKHKEFVLNVPTAQITKPFDLVDMSSSKIDDKFKMSGLTKGMASKVNAPMIVESPIHLECKVSHEFRIEPIRTMFIADVVATTVHEGVCDENGGLIVKNVDFFGMTPGSGEFYTMGKKVGYIGESQGRDDIKY